MENELTVIKDAELLGRQFQIYGTLDEPLFRAKDVAEWIEYSKSGNGSYNVPQMLASVDDDEKLVATLLVAGQRREVSFLTEDGLYEVLMLSRKPIAKQFKRGVKQILHDYRTKGIAATPATIDNILSDPEFGIRLLTELKTEREERRKQEQINAEQRRLIAEKDERLELAAPKVAFVENFAVSNGNILVRDFAKHIGQSLGVRGFGEHALFKFFRDNGYMNINRYPSQSAADMKLFHVYEGLHQISDGSMEAHHTSRITARGQVYFYEKLKSKFDREGQWW